MDYQTIIDEVKQDGKTYHVEIDFFIIPMDGEEGMDIQDIRFTSLPNFLNCPNCGKPCKQYDYIHETSKYKHKQYYRCKECVILFTEDDLK